jgi:hypothetical protein
MSDKVAEKPAQVEFGGIRQGRFLCQSVPHTFENTHQQRRFTVEVVVDGAVRDPGLFGDITDRRGMEPLFGKNGGGSIQYLVLSSCDELLLDRIVLARNGYKLQRL